MKKIVNPNEQDKEILKYIPRDIDVDHFRVAIFGSARTKKGDKAYQDVYLLAHRLAELNIDVVTGGGPGIMEAANRGHKIGRKAGSTVHSLGLNIMLPREQQDNGFLDVKRDFKTFSKRLDAFMLLSNIVIIAQGGVGTLLEFFYAWQLMQVKHTCRMPIIMMGDMWKGLLKWIKEEPLKNKLLNKEDLDPIVCASNWEEVAKLIEKSYIGFLSEGENAPENLKYYAKRVNIKQIL